MYLRTKFYEAHTLSSIWLKNYLSQMEGNVQVLLKLV